MAHSEGVAWFALIAAEARQAVRYLTRRRVFATLVVLTLGIGVGATTSLFTIVDRVLLRPLPWQEAEGLVRVYTVEPPDRRSLLSWNRGGLTWRDWDALRRTEAFIDVALWDEPLPVVLRQDRDDHVRALAVSSSFLPVLGIVAMHDGVGFSSDHDVDVTDHALVTYESWQRRFGGRSDIVGLRIATIDQLGFGSDVRVRTIIGVLPPGLDALELFFEGRALRHPRGFIPRDPPELLFPLERTRTLQWNEGRRYPAIARLAPGRTVADATSAATAITQDDGSRAARLELLAENQVGRGSLPIVLLFGGTAVLLLTACANVAGLLMSQSGARRHEIAVRRALGASQGAILRQLVIECVVMAGAAGALGLVATLWLTPALAGMVAGGLPHSVVAAIGIDSRAVGFSLALIALTTVFFGTVPSWSLSRTQASASLASGGGRTATARQRRWHTAIVATQTGFALVLLVGASLLAETLIRLSAQPLGFAPENLAALTTHTTSAGGWSAEAIPVEAVLERLAALPGVEQVAASNAVPFLGWAATSGSYRLPEAPDPFLAPRAVVSANYFETMGMPLIKGRAMSGARDVIVTEEFERRFLDGNALERTLAASGGGPSLEVVGVVADVKEYHPADAAVPLMYALEGMSSGRTHFVIKARQDPSAMLPVLRQTIGETSSTTVVVESSTMSDAVARAMATERMRATFAVALAMAAAVLVIVGVYSLTARFVSERRREIGVRLALGAQPNHVRMLVLRHGLLSALAGVVLGLPLSFAVSLTLQSFVFGVSPASLHVYAASAFIVFCTNVMATWLPATEASRVDPAIALRES